MKNDVKIVFIGDYNQLESVGPGKVLTGFIKKDNKEAKTYNINNLQTMEEFLNRD